MSTSQKRGNATSRRDNLTGRYRGHQGIVFISAREAVRSHNMDSTQTRRTLTLTADLDHTDLSGYEQQKIYQVHQYLIGLSE